MKLHFSTCGTVAALAAASVLTGCAAMMGSAGVNWRAMNPGPVPDAQLAQDQAKQAILLALKDPDSAQFRSPTPFFKTLYNFGMASVGNNEPLWAMCIEVNAKNSYGGYNGYHGWIVKFRNGKPVQSDLGVTQADYDCKNGPMDSARLAR